MPEVGIRVTLEGLSETTQGLGTLEEGLKKLAERSPENARKLADAVSAVSATVSAASAGKMAQSAETVSAANKRTEESIQSILAAQIQQGTITTDVAEQLVDAIARIGEANNHVIVSSEEVLNLQEKQAVAAQRLQKAYDDMVASATAAGKAVLFDPTGRPLTPPPAPGPGKLLAPESSGGVFDYTTSESFQRVVRETQEKRRNAEATREIKNSTVELSKEVETLLRKYDPIGAKLRSLTVDQDAFRKALSTGLKGVPDETVLRIEKGLQTEIEKTKEAMKGASKGADEYGASLVSMALKYVAPVALAQQLLSIWKESSDEGRKAELQNIKLNAVLQATGMVAGFTSSQLHKMAESMQETTAIDSERIKQAVTVLLTFKNVQGEMFERALKLGADYARLYGGDIASATRLFGRALEDPERGMTMLSRTLGRLHDDQIKMIKDLQESGNLLGAQGKLAEILEGKMGGVAKAIGESAVSAIDRFKNSWSDAMKELAKTPEDPTGAGGGFYSAAAKALAVFTQLQKSAREAETRAMMNAYKEDSENLKFSLETRQAASEKYEKLRKGLGIKTDTEIRIEHLNMVISQAQAEEEIKKDFAKKDLERQLKQIDSEIALGTKTAQDKARLLQQAANQASINETERLDFLAKSAAAIKEGEKFTLAEIAAVSQLNALVGKGIQERLSSQLALGAINKEEYEKAKTAEELRQNLIQQGLNLQEIELTKIWTIERQNAEIKKEQLQLEQQLITARGANAAEAARRAIYTSEVKTLAEIIDLKDKVTAASDREATGFFMSQYEKLKQMQLEISLIGKTKIERETALALFKLEEDRNKALGGLIVENNDRYREQVELINRTYEESREKLPALIKANADATDEINEFWKQAARNMQDSMSSLFFDIMQGKLSDLAGNFKSSIDRMVANVLAAQAQTALFGKFGQTGEPIGGWIGKGIGWLSGAFGGGGFTGVTDADLAMGFAGGGSFTVGGSGGTDSQMVRFKASPGERVTVQTPGQSEGSRIVVNNTFNISGTMDRRSQAQIAAAAGEGVQRALARNT